MSGHTKGLWIIDTPADRARLDGRTSDWSEQYPRGLRIRSHAENTKHGDVVGYELCRLSGVNDCSLPNARLMAAAPELLEALKASYRWMSKIDASHQTQGIPMGLEDQIVAAIDKAEGK